MYVIKSLLKDDRMPYYNGIEKGTARFTGKKRALRFEKGMAEKICEQLKVVDNWEWEVESDGQV